MSFNLRNIREISNDPLSKFVSHLAKRVSDFANAQQTEELENKEDIYSAGQDVDSVIKFHTLTSTKLFEFDKYYYPPFEPDLQYNTLYIQGHNMGNTTRDLSGFSNVARLYGDPILIDGTPFDYGIHDGGTKSVALRFNRPTSAFENTEGIRVDHDTRLMVDNITVGISYFMRVRLKSLAQVGGVNRRLFEKVDQTGWSSFPEDGVMICVSNAGRFDVTFRRGNTLFEKKTASGAIAVDTVYDIWVIFNQTLADGHADKIKVYINNVDKALTDGGLGYGWRSSTGNTDRTLSIMDSGGETAHGHTYGDLYDFRIYREKVVSSTEVGYMNTNKWTIENIPFGQVMISDYYADYDPGTPSASSFTSTSFTSTSFTT